VCVCVSVFTSFSDVCVTKLYKTTQRYLNESAIRRGAAAILKVEGTRRDCAVHGNTLEGAACMCILGEVTQSGGKDLSCYSNKDE